MESVQDLLLGRVSHKLRDTVAGAQEMVLSVDNPKSLDNIWRRAQRCVADDVHCSVFRKANQPDLTAR